MCKECPCHEDEEEDEEIEEETSKTDGEKSNQNVDVWLSSNLSSEEFQTLKIDDQARLRKINKKHMKFLEYHRDCVFGGWIIIKWGYDNGQDHPIFKWL